MRLLVPRLLPVVAVLLLSPGLAKATTYYVATTGNDSSACTSSSAACRTIAHATGLARSPGDIVQIAPGTYTEGPTLSSSGSAGNPITVRGQDGSGCPTLAVNDINNPTGARPASQVVVTGSMKISGSYLAVNCLHFSGNSGIEVHTGVSNVSLTQNEIQGTGTTGGGISFDGIASAQSSQYANNITIDKNYIHGVSSGIFLVCSSCTVTNNEITALTGDEPGSDHDYIDAWGVGTTIRHNYMHGNTANSCDSYDCHMDCIQTWNTTGDGTEVSKNITFDRNICFNHHEGVIVQDNAKNGDVSNWTVTNNVFAYGPWNDGSGHLAQAGSAHPWCWVFEDGKLGTNSFENNTCIDGTMGFRSNTGSAVFKDNLYVTLAGQTNFYDTSSATVTGANNLYYGSGVTLGSNFTGDVVNHDPAFVSVGTGSSSQQCIKCNFNIQSTSAAKDKGVATGVTTDLLGTTRPQGPAYDIGAYEYISGGAAPVQPSPPTNLTGTIQ